MCHTRAAFGFLESSSKTVLSRENTTEDIEDWIKRVFDLQDSSFEGWPFKGWYIEDFTLQVAEDYPYVGAEKLTLDEMTKGNKIPFSL